MRNTRLRPTSERHGIAAEVDDAGDSAARETPLVHQVQVNVMIDERRKRDAVLTLMARCASAARGPSRSRTAKGSLIAPV